MTRHSQQDEETREWASLYALDLLEADAAAAYQKHLLACDICESEVRSFANVTNSLALAVALPSPTAGLRDRIMAATAPVEKPVEAVDARTAARTAGIAFEVGGILIATSDRIPWIPTPIAGCKVRPIFEDAAARRRTTLVHLDPGTVYPAHRHEGIEELFLLEGDVTVEGYTMKVGDYCRAEAGSIHRDIRTEGGCRFLAMASVEDRFLK